MPMSLRDSARGAQGTPVAAAAIIACLLHVGLASQISIGPGRFNLMMALAGAIALTGDTRRAVYAGFFCGLFYDLTAAVPVGLMTLLLTLGSFFLASIVGMSAEGLSARSIQMFAFFAVTTSLLYGLILLFMGVQTDLLTALLGHGLVSAILTTIAAIPFIAVLVRPESGRGFSAHRRGGSRYKYLH